MATVGFYFHFLCIHHLYSLLPAGRTLLVTDCIAGKVKKWDDLPLQDVWPAIWAFLVTNNYYPPINITRHQSPLRVTSYWHILSDTHRTSCATRTFTWIIVNTRSRFPLDADVRDKEKKELGKITAVEIIHFGSKKVYW